MPGKGGAALVISTLTGSSSVSSLSPSSGRRKGGKKHKRRSSHWHGQPKEALATRIGECRGFETSRKLLEGIVEEIAVSEVEELFTFMEAIDNFLEVDVVLMYLQDVFRCKTSSLETVRIYLEDVAEDGYISARQFQKAIANEGPGQEAVAELREQLTEGNDNASRVTRDLLLDRIDWRVDRDEALSTLPLTMFYMLIFMCLVIFHLRVWERQQLERGIQNWITGYGQAIDGPYLERHVNNVGSFYAWLEASGLPAMLGDIRNGTQGLRSRIAMQNTLLGDVKVEQRHFDGVERSIWLLHSPQGVAELAAGNATLAGAAFSAAQSFRSGSWADRHTSEMGVSFATYDESHGIFAFTRVWLTVGIYGHAQVFASTSAVPDNSYPDWISYPLDAIFLLLLVFIMRKELAEMCLTGLRGFVDYWSMWNIIDWVSILLGLTNCGLWAACCESMGANELHTFLREDESGARSLRPNIMETEVSELEAMFDRLDSAHLRQMWLHIVVAANSVSIIMRFFKAFQANERLNIVAKTFASCYQDIVHFMIVFLVIFLCMAVIGHVLFGTDVRGFFTLGASLNTCFTVLMGDFDWYVSFADSDIMLPSGIPRLLMVIWFFAYMFLVSIVLLNMLLAIILEKYSEVGSLTLGPHTRTLWAQVYRYLNRMKASRGDIPLPRLRAMMEDKGLPSHPGEYVSKESLQEAWQGMSDKQANYLMNWMHSEAFLQETAERESTEVQRLRRTNRLLTRLSQKVQGVVEAVKKSNERMEELEKRMLPEGPEGTQDALPEEREHEELMQKPEEQLKSHTRTDLPQSVWAQKNAEDPLVLPAVNTLVNVD